MKPAPSNSRNDGKIEDHVRNGQCSQLILWMESICDAAGIVVYLKCGTSK
jgi:hypothetical protein